jgi:HEAT repeat protein
MLHLAFAFLALLPSTQDVDVQESRFHRVHLKNGNFIDGTLIKDTPQEIVLKLKQGNLTIGRHLVETVEFVRMRSTAEKTVKPPPAPGLQVPPPANPPAPGPKVETPEEVRKKMDDILGRFRLSKDENATLPAEELAALGDDGAAYLASRLPELDAKLQMHAASALAGLKSVRAAGVLEELLSHSSAQVRATAIMALSGLGEAEKLRTLPRMLKDPDPGVRRVLVRSLSGVQEKDWFSPLTDLIGDEDREIRSQALMTSGQLAARHGLYDDYLRLLQSSLNRATAEGRADLIAAIGGVVRPDTWKLLTPYLRDSEPVVRAATALALMNLGTPESGSDVAAAMPLERDTLTRVYLAGAAQRLRLPKAVVPLIEWLGEPQEEIRKVAAVALQTITGEALGSDRAKWEEWLRNRK